MTAIKLDRSRSFGEIFGSTDGSKYDQDGKTFNADGDLLNYQPEEPEQRTERIVEEVLKRKPGRPPKNDNAS